MNNEYVGDPFITCISTGLMVGRASENQKPVPKKVIYNGLTTIVIWEDNTKTVVKCSDGDNFHEDMGFLAAVAKKLYNHRNTYMKYVKGAYRQDDEKKKNKTDIL